MVLKKTMIAVGITRKDFQLVWISHSYDFPRKGTCYYNGNFCEFSGYEVHNLKYNMNCECEDEDDCECDNLFLDRYAIFPLSFKQRRKWKLQQWWFEKCIGYHCSYKDNKRLSDFYYRKPKWLYRLLFRFYYWR